MCVVRSRRLDHWFSHARKFEYCCVRAFLCVRICMTTATSTINGKCVVGCFTLHTPTTSNRMRVCVSVWMYTVASRICSDFIQYSWINYTVAHLRNSPHHFIFLRSYFIIISFANCNSIHARHHTDTHTSHVHSRHFDLYARATMCSAQALVCVCVPVQVSEAAEISRVYSVPTHIAALT